MMQEDGRRVEMMREVSTALFGAPFRLEILLAVANLEDESFSPSRIHAAVVARAEDPDDVPDKSTVNRTLLHLCDAALLDRPPRSGTYARRPSAVWALVSAYADEIEARFRPARLDSVG